MCLSNKLNQLHFPKKNYKTKRLDDLDARYNEDINRKRIKVEHVFKDMKVFKYLRDTCKNFVEETFNKRFIVIAGLVNLKNAF